MDILSVKKYTSGWSLVPNLTSFTGANWSDEGHFQRKCLQLNLPIVFNHLLHYPICAEFPRNPGIDLIFLAPDGNLVLAEVKGARYDAKDLIRQTIGKYHAAKTATVSNLLHYLRNKPIGHDVAENAVELVNLWLRQKNLTTTTTFEQLYSHNSLVLAVLIPGKPSQALLSAVYPPVVVYGISVAESRQTAEIYVDASNYRSSTDPAVAAQVERIGQEYLEKVHAESSRNRNRFSLAQVHAFFSSPSAPAGCRYLYGRLQQMNFQMKPGSTADYSVMVQPLDATGAPRTLLRIFGRGTFELPGNLYQQQYQWQVDESTIDQLFYRVEQLFPQQLLNRQAGKNLEILLNQGEVSTAILDEVIASLNQFLAKSRRKR